ncbi:MAG: sigma-70 family RNA polymerase sigma factor [Myxococcota bacterium]
MDDRTPQGASAPERALVDAAARGDADARRRLLAALLPTLRGATRAVLGVGADADDATQQAAIDVLRGLDTFRGDGSVKAWARTVGVRAALRIARKRRPVAVLDPEVMQAREDVTSMRESIPGELQAHLAKLPALQREAIVLRHGLGYTVPEMATLLETSANTIKSRLLQGRRALRSEIRRATLVAQARRTGDDA